MKNNNKLKFTIKWKVAYFKSKRKKKLKTLFFSLGFILTSASIITGLIFLVENAKKDDN